MSEYLDPGIHPDADSLSALAEGVLPEHERLACLAHLAECSHCREIVYLAQEPLPEPAPASVASEPVRWWKGWFAPIPALSAAAMLCTLVLSIVLYRQYNRPVVPAPELTARNTAPAVIEAPPVPLEQAPVKTAPRASARVHNEPIPADPAVPPPSPAAPEAVVVNGLPAGELAGVAGTITDPVGGVIPKAQINLVDNATGKTFASTSDARGQFSVDGLAPGNYRLNIFSPGFKQSTKQLDLQPLEIAQADSTLEVGALTDTVTVNAEAPLLKTESGELGHVVTTDANSLPVFSASANRAPLVAGGALPGKLPAVTTASKDKLILAADSAGGLFLSKDSGTNWTAVNGPWKGKAVRLATVPDPAKASNVLFQLTTDSASVWLSADGDHWTQAPAQRR